MAMVKQHCPGEGTMAPMLPSQGPWLRPAGEWWWFWVTQSGPSVGQTFYTERM